MTSSARCTLDIRRDSLKMKAPFRISGRVFDTIPVLRVTLARSGHVGRGEAAGVYYLHDTQDKLVEQVEHVRAQVEAGISREALRRLFPPGGARNAIDSALWELESLEQARPAWALAGLARCAPVQTTLTLCADDPAAMAAAATALGAAKALKLKLTGESALDVARLAAVRRARPDAWLSVDANQGYTPGTIAPLLAALVTHDVQLLEQPFARGREQDMRSVRFPIPTAADESCLDLAELEALPGLFDVVNIKPDKCGGLTEGLLMCRRARALGLRAMVGNMGGSSLAMAPAYVLAQLCDLVDLDGPFFLADEAQPAFRYVDGVLSDPGRVWGFRAADVKVAA
jgi:L-alanine-DL-glutamate epimerase-like enolase superfamily enzyme